MSFGLMFVEGTVLNVAWSKALLTQKATSLPVCICYNLCVKKVTILYFTLFALQLLKTSLKYFLQGHSHFQLCVA